MVSRHKPGYHWTDYRRKERKKERKKERNKEKKRNKETKKQRKKETRYFIQNSPQSHCPGYQLVIDYGDGDGVVE